MSIDYMQGKWPWLWIERIANLTKKKIIWDKSFASEDTKVFSISADGIDFKMWHDLETWKFSLFAHGKVVILSLFACQHNLACAHILPHQRGGKLPVLYKQ
jgi:hypothetical protein